MNGTCSTKKHSCKGKISFFTQWLFLLEITIAFEFFVPECVNATSLSLCLHYELVFHHKWKDAQFFMADVQFFGADAPFFRADVQFFAAGLL